MSKSIQEALLDLKARQEAGEQMPCPRCGRGICSPASCRAFKSSRAS